LNRSKEFDRYAVNLAKKKGIKLVRLCTRYDQFYRVGKSVLVPTIGEFLSLIDYADLVLTDSFHATAFSLNLNTIPICIFPGRFGGRMESLLRLTGCMGCHAKDFDDYDVLNNNIDFDHVNSVLNDERKRVNHYINEVLEAARKY
jgi:hypothetical protein